jgi:cytochrome c oxidase cbb3-type subunit I/II
MMNPRDLVGLSIMPNYPWLLAQNTNFYGLRKKISVMKNLGVPYTDDDAGNADILAENQAKTIAENLRKDGVEDDHLEQREIVALIAYLQALGKKGNAGGAAGAMSSVVPDAEGRDGTQ